MNKQLRLNKLIKQASLLNGAIKELKKRYNKERISIISQMNRSNLKKYDTGEYVATIHSGYKKTAFSLAKFRRLNAPLYTKLAESKKYNTTRTRRPSVYLKHKLLNN